MKTKRPRNMLPELLERLEAEQRKARKPAPAVLLVAAGPDKRPRRILRQISRGGRVLG